MEVHTTLFNRVELLNSCLLESKRSVCALRLRVRSPCRSHHVFPQHSVCRHFRPKCSLCLSLCPFSLFGRFARERLAEGPNVGGKRFTICKFETPMNSKSIGLVDNLKLLGSAHWLVNGAVDTVSKLPRAQVRSLSLGIFNHFAG